MEKLNFKKIGRDLLLDTIGAILVSIGIISFTKNAGIAPGGVAGVSLILHYFFPQLPLGTLQLLLNVPLILISLRYLSKPFLLRTFRTLLVTAFFMDVIFPMFPAYETTEATRFLASCMAGFFVGAGLAVVFGNASCTGGTDLVIMCMKKVHPHMSFGTITLIVDSIIIFTGGIVYKDINAVLYGFVFTIVSAQVMDKMMYGVVSGKMALIITENSQPIAAGIHEHVSRGATILEGKGSYSGGRKEVLLCALSRQQMPELRKVLRKADPASLLITMEYNEVYGTGFQSLLDDKL